MARGGYRPGAGRPKGTKETAQKLLVQATPPVPSDIKVAAHTAGLDPLQYMLQVMNDAGAEDGRRDRMAIAAAPFVHVKPGEAAGSVKAQKQAAGEKIAKGGGKFAAPAPPARLAVDNTR